MEYKMKTKLQIAITVLSIALGGLVLFNAILGWIATPSLGGNFLAAYIISSLAIAVGAVGLIALGCLSILLDEKFAHPIFLILILITSALSSVLFANLVQGLLTFANIGLVITFFVFYIRKQEKPKKKQQEAKEPAQN